MNLDMTANVSFIEIGQKFVNVNSIVYVKTIAQGQHRKT